MEARNWVKRGGGCERGHGHGHAWEVGVWNGHGGCGVDVWVCIEIQDEAVLFERGTVGARHSWGFGWAAGCEGGGCEGGSGEFGVGGEEGAVSIGGVAGVHLGEGGVRPRIVFVVASG